MRIARHILGWICRALALLLMFCTFIIIGEIIILDGWRGFISVSFVLAIIAADLIITLQR